MAVTETYVDPSIAADSGAGTSGDPYGDLEYALEQTTPGTDGDRFNIKAGTDEILEFALDIVTDYGTPTSEKPIIFQGYTSAAADGGIGGISGGASVSIIDASTLDYVHFVDMHLHNCGSNKIVNLDNYCSLINCEIDGSSSTATQGLNGANGTHIIHCYIHDCAGGFAAECQLFNHYKTGPTNDWLSSGVIYRPSVAYRNIIDADNAHIQGNGFLFVANNSAYSSTPTNYKNGYVLEQYALNGVFINNIMQGMSALDGEAVNAASSNHLTIAYGGNVEYDCTDGFTNPPMHVITDFGDANETLSASPYDTAGSDYSPVDTGGVKEGSVPPDVGDGT